MKTFTRPSNGLQIGSSPDGVTNANLVPVLVDVQVFRMEVTAVHAVGDHFLLLLAELDQPLAVLIFDVDDRGTRRLGARSLKENRLRGEIFFHGAVVVEMIAGEIGEDRYIERHTVNPLLLKSMGGNFHHRFGAARVRARARRTGSAPAVLEWCEEQDKPRPQCGTPRCRPTRPCGQLARSIAFNRNEVVVLPLVPVIPVMESRSAGRP